MSALERPGAPGSARERYQRPGSAVGALGAGWERWERCWLAGTWVGGSAGSARVGGLAGWEPRLGRGGSGGVGALARGSAAGSAS